jgi:hypothetical protein
LRSRTVRTTIDNIEIKLIMTDTEQTPAFQAFAQAFRLTKDGDELRNSRWWVDVRHPFHDFCKEIVEPGTNKQFSRGAIAIRTDDDFWIVGAIPLRFRDVSCAEIVNTFWPRIENALIRPDSGSHWWIARYDDSLEVPGEPFEAWAEMTYPDGTNEWTRINTFATLAEADKQASALGKTKINSAHRMSVHVQSWTLGKRQMLTSFEVTPSAV